MESRRGGLTRNAAVARTGLPLLVATILVARWPADHPAAAADLPADGAAIKAAVRVDADGPNLLESGAWRPHGEGFRDEDGHVVCENGTDSRARRGAAQTVVLNQTRPSPIVATAWSRAEGVTGSPDPDYALYIDLIYDDGSELWGQSAAFRTGTHDWQQARVVIVPDRPVRRLTMNLLFRGHGGTARFRDATLRTVEAPEGSFVFDGVPVLPRAPIPVGFQVRDVAANGDFVRIGREAEGLQLVVDESERDGAHFVDATLTDTTGRDRAVTLVYALPVPPVGVRWLDDPRRSEPVVPGRDHVRATSFRVGSSGRLSMYPLGAVDGGPAGHALALDPAFPAYYRIGYHAGTGELYLAYDLGLTPERPSARLRFCRYDFDPAWGFRSALATYYRLFPEAFHVRAREQGLWMPFAKISAVEGWEDFGFQFKEGHDETPWDDAHGITTFRYTEPLTWWMPMPRDLPRTLDAALAEARRLADSDGRRSRQAQALFTSGYHDADGRFTARLIDAPWNDGAVWSMNSMPGIPGDVTDFALKWSPRIRDRFYGPDRRGDLDGEYVDSSEGYVSDELDFRRDHFPASTTPLVFDPDTHRPAIFRGLIAQEYVRGIAEDLHGMGKLMMANSTPGRMFWLAPMLDVMGTEADWNPGGRWRPWSDTELLYRRAMCKGKPFCFLLNTEFDRLPPERVESYMKRSLAYGMFPGFFSENASDGHYFSRPELYNRDRRLFRRYVPLCTLVAEAGWEPITHARSDDDRVYVERFGEGDVQYLTVFNDSPEPRTATITLDGPTPASGRELVRDREVAWDEGRTTLELDGEDVAVLELRR